MARPTRAPETPKMEAAPPPLPEVQVPDYKPDKLRWSKCQECGEQVWLDHCGNQFYHRLSCSLTNNIRYRCDREGGTK